MRPVSFGYACMRLATGFAFRKRRNSATVTSVLLSANERGMRTRCCTSSADLPISSGGEPIVNSTGPGTITIVWYSRVTYQRRSPGGRPANAESMRAKAPGCAHTSGRGTAPVIEWRSSHAIAPWTPGSGSSLYHCSNMLTIESLAFAPNCSDCALPRRCTVARRCCAVPCGGWPRAASEALAAVAAHATMLGRPSTAAGLRLLTPSSKQRQPA